MTNLAPLHQTAHLDLTKLFQRAAIASSAIVFCIGLGVLMGWQLHLPLLMGSFADDLAPMSIQSALVFMVAALSLGCLKWRPRHQATQRISQVFAIVVIVFGLLSLITSLSDWQLDQRWIAPLVDFQLASTIRPTAMSTGLNFVLIGSALLSSGRTDRTWQRVAQVLTLAVALIAVNALVNNVHPIGLPPLYPAPKMALTTALTFLILGAGIQALHLDEAVMRVIQISEGSSEGMVCQLLQAAIALAILEAFVTLWGQPQTPGDTIFNLSFLTLKTAVIFTLLIGWSISLLTRIRQDYQQAEAVVEDREVWLEMAQEAAHLGRWDWDVQQDLLQWCDQQAKLFGIATSVFSGTQATFLLRVHPDDRPLVQRHLSQTIEAQQNYYDEFRVVWADQSVHWIASKGRCFYNETGQAIRMSGVSFEITEYRQMQEERDRLLQLEQVARAKAEAANRTKDEFLTILSHEIRTPLNSVLGWIRLFRSRSLNPEIVARGLDALERNAEAQAQILEDMLDMARVVQGRLQLQMSPTDVSAVIAAVIDTIRPAAQAKRIHIHTQLDPTIDRLVCDPNRLRQIVWNLMCNAVKFTPPEGKVEVILMRVDQFVQIQISDTGRGIDPDFLPYVFDRFRQEDSTLTRSYGGLGLGLALVRYLAELHGGTVEAASPGIDQGATFTLKLPCG